MGTINYRSGDVITVGMLPFDFDGDYETEHEEYEHAQWEYDMDVVNDCEYLNSKIETLDFYYYNVKAVPGYYEGYYIDIDRNFPVCFDVWEDKKYAQKELTRLKSFLLDCVKAYNLNVVYPGWCTSYEDYENSISCIVEAIKEERENVRNTPTWLYYENNRPCRK